MQPKNAKTSEQTKSNSTDMSKALHYDDQVNNNNEPSTTSKTSLKTKEKTVPTTIDSQISPTTATLETSPQSNKQTQYVKPVSISDMQINTLKTIAVITDPANPENIKTQVPEYEDMNIASRQAIYTAQINELIQQQVDFMLEPKITLTFPKQLFRYQPTPMLQPLMVYTSQLNTSLETNIQHLDNGPLDSFTRSSEEIFKYGTDGVYIVPNREFLATLKIENQFSYFRAQRELTMIGADSSSLTGNVLENITAELALLAYFVSFNSVYQLNQNKQFATNLAQQYGFINNVPHQQPVLPSPVIARFKLNVPWFQQAIDAALNDGQANYKYGRVDVSHDPYFDFKIQEAHAVNIDKYAAALYNINARNVHTNRTGLNRIRDTLLAFSWPNTRVWIANEMTLIPTVLPRVDLMTNCFVMVGSRDNTLHQIVDALYYNYYEQSNIGTPTLEVSAISKEISLGSAQTLQNEITNLMPRAEVDQILLYIAREIPLRLRIPTFRPLQYLDSSSISIIGILGYALLFCFLPHQSHIYHRIIQSQIINFIRQWFTDEYKRFMTIYGLRYKYEQGRQIFSQSTQEFTDDDLFSEEHPSLFAGIEFDGCPHITRIMSIFKPIGYIYTPTRAINAEFPYLSNDRNFYIGYPAVINSHDSSMGDHIRTIGMTIMAIFDKVMNQSKARNAIRSQIASQIQHILDRALLISDAFADMIRPIQETQANFNLSLTANFKGAQASHINTNYAVFTDSSMLTNNSLRKLDTSGLRFDASMIFPLLFNMDYTVLKQRGQGREGVAIDYKYAMPSPQEYSDRAHMIYQDMLKLCMAEGILQEIFSANHKDSALSELEQHFNLRFSSTNYNDMLKIISSRLGVNITTYLKGWSTITSTLTTDGRLRDAIIRRITDTRMMIPYDRSIDPPFFESPMSLLDEAGLNRLILGAKYLNQTRHIFKGLRLYKQSIRLQNAQDMHVIVPDDYVEREFSDDLFTIRKINGINRWCVLVGEDYIDDPERWPKYHILITLTSTAISTQFVDRLCAGIEHAGWIVDVDTRYAAALTNRISEVTMQKAIVASILQSSIDQIHELLFLYHPLRIDDSDYTFPHRGDTFQYIFPMSDIVKTFSCGGLAVSTSKAHTTFGSVPVPLEYDTGTITIDGKNAFTNGTHKLDVPVQCQTNIVYGFTKAYKIENDIEVEITAPAYLYE
ncbi:VP1 [Lutzomyia reovirus 1]|uniref:VP1 n=1 Tax=Lutzomyia reovirus 1 TaxID=1670669 RepID=UPI00065EEE12|nr:VP1 [Lutzomyia reovirus 1]AKP18604.1 VP1 [Lutzomyia reovirus 1]